MSKEIHLTKKHYVAIVALAIAFIVSCVYGYVLLKEGQRKETCWEKYGKIYPNSGETVMGICDGTENE